MSVKVTKECDRCGCRETVNDGESFKMVHKFSLRNVSKIDENAASADLCIRCSIDIKAEMLRRHRESV